MTTDSALPRRLRRRVLAGACVVASVLVGLVACSRGVVVESSPPASPPPAPLPSSSATDPPSPVAAPDAGDAASSEKTPWIPKKGAEIDGPYESLYVDAGRPIYWAMPKDRPKPWRLVGHLHGMCGPPPYACGKWIGAGTDVGIMVCPTGNARCGDSPVSPASWEAPTWMELVSIMDRDLETSIAKVEAKSRGSIDREGAVLTGYSRGAYAAPQIARMHPKRWPLLVLIEANVPLSVASLRASGVRAVALVAGEQGTEIAGEQKTQLELERAGFPAKLFVMKHTGHPYSEDMEYVMHDALSFVLAHEHDEDEAARRDAAAP